MIELRNKEAILEDFNQYIKFRKGINHIEYIHYIKSNSSNSSITYEIFGKTIFNGNLLYEINLYLLGAKMSFSKVNKEKALCILSIFFERIKKDIKILQLLELVQTANSTVYLVTTRFILESDSVFKVGILDTTSYFYAEGYRNSIHYIFSLDIQSNSGLMESVSSIGVLPASIYSSVDKTIASNQHKIQILQLALGFINFSDIYKTDKNFTDNLLESLSMQRIKYLNNTYIIYSNTKDKKSNGDINFNTIIECPTTGTIIESSSDTYKAVLSKLSLAP